jgi:hypothetical protein
VHEGIIASFRTRSLASICATRLAEYGKNQSTTHFGPSAQLLRGLLYLLHGHSLHVKVCRPLQPSRSWCVFTRHTPGSCGFGAVGVTYAGWSAP